MPRGRSWTAADVQVWFTDRVPDHWFDEPLECRTDREEILVVGHLRDADADADTGPDADAGEAAAIARIAEFREESRHKRMAIAEEAETLWGRKVSWGVRSGGVSERFTTQSVPVMTRLRMDERAVLDTLIDAGVARSRSEALAWCVRLVGEHQGEWIDALRAAVADVARVRADGP